MARVSVRDIDMYYEECGRSDGEPLVLIHGFFGTGRGQWGPFLDRLGRDYRLIVPDWRGHGRTTNPSGVIIHGEIAKDMAAFCEAIGLDRAHFSGISSGAMQLLFLALDRPELVHTLSLAAGTYTFDEHARAVVKERAGNRTEGWLDALQAAHGETHGPGYGRVLIDLWAASVQRSGELPFTPKDLEGISCPTLIVHGDRDQFFPVHIPVAMYQAIPSAELCILPQCDHGVRCSHAAHFSAVLVNFLGRNPIADSNEGVAFELPS